MSPEDVTIEGIQEGTHKIEVGEEILLNGKPVTVTSVETNKPMEPADLGASKPIEHKPTSKEIGEWRNANFTVKQGTVKACGHKFDPHTFPKQANCWDCWEATFSSSPEGVASVHQLLLTGGTKAVVAMHGQKFTKMFGRFLRNQLLREYASKEVQAASGIEGSVMDIQAERSNADDAQLSS